LCGRMGPADRQHDAYAPPTPTHAHACTAAWQRTLGDGSDHRLQQSPSRQQAPALGSPTRTESPSSLSSDHRSTSPGGPAHAALKERARERGGGPSSQGYSSDEELLHDHTLQRLHRKGGAPPRLPPKLGSPGISASRPGAAAAAADSSGGGAATTDDAPPAVLRPPPSAASAAAAAARVRVLRGT
jgi:hypothetical protein